MPDTPRDQDPKGQVDASPETPVSKEEGQTRKQISPLVITILGGIGTALLAIGNNAFQWFQTQSAEALKLRAALIQKAMEPSTAQARKDYLLFLVKAGLITDPGNKIRDLKPEEIPHQFGFIPSAALTPELVSTLDSKLTAFRDYLRSIGLQADTKPRVNIRAREEMKIPGMHCYYDSVAEGGPQLVIEANYAEDADLALREYSHRVMALNRPAGEPKYDAAWETYWPHFAIESALAFYLPCSFNNNPRFAEIAVQKGLDAPAINLAKSHKLTELKADPTAMYYEDAEIWGSLFWELRTKFGAQKVDGLLARAWFTLNENTPADAQNKAFAAAIMQAASAQLGADSAAEIRKIFTARGLPL